MQIYLQPGEKISKQTLEALSTTNSTLTNTADHKRYREEMANIFGLNPQLNIGMNEKYFLGGFIEGEGSINVSAKKLRNAAYGLLIDCEFSIAQHVNGVELLYLALVIFETGRIRYKGGSNATLTLVIDNRQSLEEKVVPFYKQFVNPIGSAVKTQRVQDFLKILLLIKNHKHQNVDTLADEILPIWDSMRMQKGQSNQTFPNLEKAQEYVRNFRVN